jgi:hypothetical protein
MNVLLLVYLLLLLLSLSPDVEVLGLEKSGLWTNELLLPDASSNPSLSETRQLEVGGEPLALDEYGPIIINHDGSGRRIVNWNALTPTEQDIAKRRVAKRNKERIDKLKIKETSVE